MPDTNDTLPVRRIVTGHDQHNKAVVIKDGIDLSIRRGTDGFASTLIWCTDQTPADISIGLDVEDMGQRKLGTAPPPRGSRVTVNDIPPHAVGRMHRTETIDYVFVLKGEVEMELDDSTVKMKAGDVMVQRGTYHAWHNRTDEPARIAFVLVDAEPLGIGSPVTGLKSAADGR
jgi:quercetin dioxygenase-like cupin family protein